MNKLVVIRGAGELATGIAHRLYNSGFRVLMLEKENPSAIRRNIVFAEAVYDGEKQVERVTCYKASDVKDAEKRLKAGQMVILVDVKAESVKKLKPEVLIDAIYAKQNMGTTIDMAPLTIGIGPGFAAGKDVNFVIETTRGHNLGRIIREGQAMPEKEAIEVRALMKSSHTIIAPCSGYLEDGHPLSFQVQKDETIVKLVIPEENRTFEIKAPFGGVLRGLIHDGCPVKAGLKIAEIDPSTRPANCFTISAKSRCISGSVLEVILAWELNKPKKSSIFGFKSK